MDLDLLGLNAYEAQAYQALLEIQESTAAQVSQHSQVPYGRIYDVLASLESKGLVRVIPRRTKHFIPTSPKKLQTLLEDKQRELAQVGKQLQEMTSRYEQHTEQVVEVVKGHKNFFRFLDEIPEPQEYKYSIKHTSRYHGKWVLQTKDHLKKGINKRVLVRLDEETKEDVSRWQDVIPEQRSFDNDGVALFVQDNGVMIGLINNNTTMFIRDKAFTDVMKRLFEAAYDDAPEIKKNDL